VLLVSVIVGYIVWTKSKSVPRVREFDDEISWQWKYFLEKPTKWKKIPKIFCN